MEGAYSNVYAEEEKLIKAVCGFPSLWQVSNRDLRAKENAWKLVASQVCSCFRGVHLKLFVV